MSRNTKIVLGAIVGVLVLCVCVSAAGIAALAAIGRESYAINVERAFQVEKSLGAPVPVDRAPLQYDMPAGWRQDFNVHILGFEMTALGGNDGHSHIFLLQVPPGTNVDAAMKQALDQAGSSRTTYRNGIKFERVGTRDVILRGQPVTMTISEGTNRDGATYRQLAGVAHDADSQTVVVIEQPVQSWDAEMFDAFIASIR